MTIPGRIKILFNITNSPQCTKLSHTVLSHEIRWLQRCSAIHLWFCHLHYCCIQLLISNAMVGNKYRTAIYQLKNAATY